MSRKSEVYTWRVSQATKVSLEELARREGRTLAQLLDEAVAARLEAAGAEPAAEAQRQRRLHSRAARFAGGIAGDNPRRGKQASALVRARLQKRRRDAR